jgi:F0F1-type ATP synthase delta subunit
MYKTVIKIEVQTAEKPTPGQLKDIRWAVQAKIKELEHDDELGEPFDPLVKGAFVMGEDE